MKYLKFFLLAFFTILLLLAVGICGGSYWLSFEKWREAGEWNPIFVLRFTRQIAAFIIGTSLALSGAVFQTVLRNPLAEPFTLGISGGAGVGAALAVVFNLNAIFFLSIPICALAGALIVLSVVLFVSGTRRDGGETVLLGGVIVGTICGSVLMYILSISDNDQLASVTWWMLGDLQTPEPHLLGFSAVILMVAMIVLRGVSGALNSLAFGDCTAWNFGGDPVRLRRFLILLASLLAAGTVALAGIIGFVGLMIPHAVRRFCGCDHRKILPALAVAGGGFLMFCDFISRVADPVRELPIGVITAALGGTLFLFLLKRRRQL